tara:strand:- start:80 stop:490 length:411 start_codon:yes stop_codon:yes gene_type:complete
LLVVVASALWFSFSFLLIAFCSLLLLLFVLVKGAHGQHPSVILDRAKKKLLDEMSLKTKASPVRPLGSVSADLIDPSKSPFAQGMNRKDMAELRNRIPGMKKLKQQKVESVLDLEVKASTDANRDARLAALSMLNE